MSDMTSMSNDNDRNDVELIAERVGTEVFGKPCHCRICDGQKPFEFVASPDNDGTMEIGLPIAVADFPEYIAGVVLGEVFKAVKGDPTARPSAALNAAYHTMSDALADIPTFMRDPSLDDAMELYADAGLVPEYAVALMFDVGGDAFALPIHSAISCAMSRRLVDAVKASTRTQEEEARVLALALAYPLGQVLSGSDGRNEGATMGLALAHALGIPEEDFDTLHEIVNRL